VFKCYKDAIIGQPFKTNFHMEEGYKEEKKQKRRHL